MHAENNIDLRSDTVTRPTQAMRAAMAAAAVGDDQYGEDPTTNRLQQVVAELLGKEAALWLPSGTMANQVALRVLTRPGDDVIVSRECHAVWHETGGSAANSGVQFTEIGSRGTFTVDDFAAAVQAARSCDLSTDDTARDREHAQPLGRHRLSAAAGRGAVCSGTRARGSDISRWRAPLECGRRQRPRAAGAGGPVRSRGGGAVEGPRCAGRVTARGFARVDRARDAVSPHVRRRDAPDRPLCRRRAVCDRASPCATGRGPRERAAHRASAGGQPACRHRPGHGADQHHRVPPARGCARRGHRRRSGAGNAACCSFRSARERCVR